MGDILPINQGSAEIKNNPKPNDGSDDSLAQLGGLLQMTVDEHSYLMLLPHAATDYIQKKVATERIPYEIDMLRDMKNRLAPGDHVLDIGANIGNHTLYLASVAGCKVTAFEPNEDLCGPFLSSIELNALSERVSLRAVALGKKRGAGHFIKQNPENLGAWEVEVGSGPIQIAPLDSFSFKGRIKAIKIDVEGMELAVLEGGAKLIKKNRPLLYVECQNEAAFRDVYAWLSLLDYDYWDTFNATPTHLFLPNEQTSVKLRLSRIQFKAAHAAYNERLQIEKLRTNLTAANLKYRASTEQVATLKQRLAQEEQARKGSEELIASIRSHQIELEQQVKQEDKSHQAIIAAHAGRLEALREESLSAEKQLARLEGLSEGLQARLSDAGIKYDEIKQLLEQERARFNDELRHLREQVEPARRAELDAEKRALKLEGREQSALVRQQSLEQQIKALTQHLEATEQAKQNGQKIIAEMKETLAKTGEQLDKERQNHRQATAVLTDELRAASTAAEALENKVAQLEADASALQKSLDSAQQNAARRAAENEEIVEQLRSRLSGFERRFNEERLCHQAETEQLKAQIEALHQDQNQLANLRQENDGLRNDLRRLSSETEILRAEGRDKDHDIERLRIEIANSKKPLAQALASVERLRQEKNSAEFQIDKIRDTLSFRLGHKLIYGFKSWRSLRSLPRDLLALRHEALKRRAEKKAGSLGMQPLAARQGFATRLPIPLPKECENTAAFIQKLSRLKIAGIMDDFTFHSFREECNLLQLTPANWEQELAAFKPEMLLIESAWRGKEELWCNKVAHKCQELIAIVAWCKDRKIPTVFWNKEDPPHFEVFLNTAVLFDFIFTTDVDCIHRYKRALGHDRVYLLPFACQPALQNPIEKYQRKNAFCFAGSYYARYPDRARDLNEIVSCLSAIRPLEIYDRNYGKTDPIYQFPEEYKRFIVGNLPFDQIDKAYKGYRFAVNMNTIKQSQTMFARRAYELLASNTITVSNFSRGLRLLLGDLVIASDNASEIEKSLRLLTNDDTRARKFRLAGLRKVMQEHTYQDRMAYVASKVQGMKTPSLLPFVVVTAYANTQERFDALIGHYMRQRYSAKALILVVTREFTSPALANGHNIHVIAAHQIKKAAVGDVLGDQTTWVAGMVAEDYYGPHYLTDLALATRYSNGPVIGKIAHYAWTQAEGLFLRHHGKQYRTGASPAARSALVRTEYLENVSMRDWITSLYTRTVEDPKAMAVDEFNYARNAAHIKFEHLNVVNDLDGLSTGIDVDDLLHRAEQIPPHEVAYVQDDVLVWKGDKLSTLITSTDSDVKLTVSETALQVDSCMPDGKHVYCYLSQGFTPNELGFTDKAKFYLDSSAGLNMQVALFFLDKDRKRLGQALRFANTNHTVDIPPGTAWIRWGLRFYASGSAKINELVLGHRNMKPVEIIGRARSLLLTNHYPSYEDIYRNAFIHRRILAYRETGIATDVYRLNKQRVLSYHEFEGVDVMNGDADGLQKLLNKGQYKSILVHFLDETMWSVLQHHIDHTKIFVWVHGAEIQKWQRRAFKYTTEEFLAWAKADSDKRMTFWRSLLAQPHPNLKLIFVSQTLACGAMEDLGFKLPRETYTVIHNPIDTALFNFQEKSVEQRKKILSIRPYASRIYANDLSVKAIIELSTKPYFNDLEFRLIGDGRLFEETVAPVRDFKNVYIEQRFLLQSEIAALHKTHGIFLCPSRMDSQGVSRDEAMASGLVPVTNRVAAIPEFVDDGCGIMVPAEDAKALADGIARLYEEPETFLKMSRAAAQRVRGQRDSKLVIPAELALFQ